MAPEQNQGQSSKRKQQRNSPSQRPNQQPNWNNTGNSSRPADRFSDDEEEARQHHAGHRRQSAQNVNQQRTQNYRDLNAGTYNPNAQQNTHREYRLPPAPRPGQGPIYVRCDDSGRCEEVQVVPNSQGGLRIQENQARNQAPQVYLLSSSNETSTRARNQPIVVIRPVEETSSAGQSVINYYPVDDHHHDHSYYYPHDHHHGYGHHHGWGNQHGWGYQHGGWGGHYH